MTFGAREAATREGAEDPGSGREQESPGVLETSLAPLHQ